MSDFLVTTVVRSLRKRTETGFFSYILAPVVGFCVSFPASGLDSYPVLPREDTRLDRTVSLDEIGISLEELLRNFSDRSLSLSCNRACAMQKVQVHLRQRPLRAVLEALAEWLPGTWRRLQDGSGYRLEMDEAAVRRREHWWRLFEGERERAIATQRAHTLQQMRAEPYYRKPGDPISPEGYEPWVEEQEATAQEFFRGLPAALQERIANQMNEMPLYSLGPVIYGTQDEEGAIVVPVKDLPMHTQEIIRRRIGHFASKDAFTNLDGRYLFFTNGGGIVYANINVTLPNNRNWIVTAFSLTTTLPPLNAPLLTLDQCWLAETVQRLGHKAPATWKQLAEYQQSHVWSNDLPSRRLPELAHINRAAVLLHLGEKADLEFLSDYYSLGGRPLYPEEKDRPFAHSLTEALNLLAAEHDTSWKKRSDNLYLFRHNRWYRNDGLEVPAPLLRRWLAWQAEQEEARVKTDSDPKAALRQLKQGMDWQAEVIAALTPWQIQVGLQNFTPPEVLRARDLDKRAMSAGAAVGGRPPRFNVNEVFPFGRDALYIIRWYRTLQFYAGLDDSRRAALLEGRLALHALSPAQQEQVLYLLPRLRWVLEESGGPIWLGLKSVALSDGTSRGRLAFRLADADEFELR